MRRKISVPADDVIHHEVRLPVLVLRTRSLRRKYLSGHGGRSRSPRGIDRVARARQTPEVSGRPRSRRLGMGGIVRQSSLCDVSVGRHRRVCQPDLLASVNLTENAIGQAWSLAHPGDDSPVQIRQRERRWRRPYRAAYCCVFSSLPSQGNQPSGNRLKPTARTSPINASTPSSSLSGLCRLFPATLYAACGQSPTIAMMKFSESDGMSADIDRRAPLHQAREHEAQPGIPGWGIRNQPAEARFAQGDPSMAARIESAVSSRCPMLPPANRQPSLGIAPEKSPRIRPQPQSGRARHPERTQIRIEDDWTNVVAHQHRSSAYQGAGDRRLPAAGSAGQRDRSPAGFHATRVQRQHSALVQEHSGHRSHQEGFRAIPGARGKAGKPHLCCLEAVAVKRVNPMCTGLHRRQTELWANRLRFDEAVGEPLFESLSQVALNPAGIALWVRS